MNKTFIDSIISNSFDSGFVKPFCPINKEHRVYIKKYRNLCFMENVSNHHPTQCYCADCDKYYTVIDSSYMKYHTIPRYLIFKIIMIDKDVPARIIAEEYGLSINTIYRYRRKFKQEAILIKECIKDNKITTFNQLKEFYHSNKLKAYENKIGKEMPKIENYK